MVCLPYVSRVAKLAGGALFWLILPLLVLLLGVLCVVTWGERPIAGWVSAALKPVLQGSLQIARIEALSIDGLRGVDLQLLDEEGRIVGEAHDVDVDVAVLDLAAQLFSNEPHLLIDIQRVHVRYLRLDLTASSTGEPRFVRALTPVQTRQKSQPSTPLFLSIHEIFLKSGWVHGVPAPGLLTDVDLSRVSTSLVLKGDELRIENAELASNVRYFSGLKDVALGLRGRSEMSLSPAAVEPTAALHHTKLPSLLRRTSVELALSQADARVHLRADQVGKDLKIEGDATATAAELGRRGLPETNVRVHLRSAGTLEEFESDIGVSADGATATLTANTKWQRDLQIQGKIVARSVPDSWLLPPTAQSTAPSAADIDVDLSFAATRSAESRLSSPRQKEPEWSHWKGKVRGDVASFVYGEHSVPPIALQAEFDAPKFSLLVQSPSDPARLFARASGQLDRDQKLPSLRMEARADLADVRPYVPGLLAGAGPIRAGGSLSPEEGTITASVRAELKGVRFRDAIAANSLELRGNLNGPLKDPRIEAALGVKGARLFSGTQAARDIQEAELTWRGTFQKSKVTLSAKENARMWEVSSALELSERLRATNARVALSEGAKRTALRVASIEVEGSRVRLLHLTLAGAGEVDLNANIEPGNIFVQGMVRDLPIAELARRLSLDVGGLEGVVDLDVDLRLKGTKVDGRLRLIVAEAGLRGEDQRTRNIPPLDVSVDLVGTGQSVLVNYAIQPTRGESSDRLSLQGELAVTVPPTHALREPQAWLQGVMRGQVTGALSLGAVPTELLPEGLNAKGHVDVRAHLVRTEIGAVPSFRLFLRTTGIEVTYREPGTEKDKKSSIQQISQVDAMIHLAHEPEKEESSAGISLFHKGRSLGHLRVRASAKRDNWNGGLSSLLDVPLSAQLDVPMTRLSTLPSALGTQEMAGLLGARAMLEGTLRDPSLEANLHLKGFKQSQEVDVTPLSAHLHVSYERDAATWDARVTKLGVSKARTECLSLAGEAIIPFDVTGGNPELRSLNLDAKFTDFPLSVFGVDPLGGTLTGDLAVHKYGTGEPLLEAQLDLNRVEVSSVPLSRGKLRATADHRAAAIELSVKDEAYSIDARVRGGLRWNTRLVPTLDGNALGKLETDNFPLRLLRPAVDQSLADLDGTLDARFEVKGSEAGTFVTGEGKLRDGRVQLPSLGQQFRDVNANIIWQENGEIVLENASFRGTTGKGRLEGSVRMEGLLPEEAKVRLRVDRRERLPLSLQGLGLGEFWGDVESTADFSWDERLIRTQVKFREFQVVFPTLPSGSVQSLAPDERVRAGAWITEDEFVEVPLQPVDLDHREVDPWNFEAVVKLGRAFWVQQGARRRIRLGGEVSIASAEEVIVSGQVTLSQGRIELNGRMFEIREGKVTLQPDQPDNPIIVAEARWESPDGIVVIARFLGPVKSGEMTLTSEPPLPQGQILSLLLFGDTGGLSGATDSSGNGDAQAIAVGGSIATKGLNQALTRFEAVDISTRVGKSESDSVRPEVVIQLTNSVSAEVGYNLEEPSPGHAPDRTIVSLEVRLAGGNSVSATVGDEGSTFFDWLWRYRY